MSESAILARANAIKEWPLRSSFDMMQSARDVNDPARLRNAPLAVLSAGPRLAGTPSHGRGMVAHAIIRKMAKNGAFLEGQKAPFSLIGATAIDCNALNNEDLRRWRLTVISGRWSANFFVVRHFICSLSVFTTGTGMVRQMSGKKGTQRIDSPRRENGTERIYCVKMLVDAEDARRC